MTFKLHLVIVLVIMVAVYIAWSVSSKPEPIAATPVVKQSPYSIAIAHASWGMNCRYYRNANDEDGGNAPNKIREDNVLMRISDLCNGKLICDADITPDLLGDDPAPTCHDKELVIEYRCFSFDRPQRAHGMSGSVRVNCDRPVK